jgi:hypothetical protein
MSSFIYSIAVAGATSLRNSSYSAPTCSDAPFAHPWYGSFILTPAPAKLYTSDAPHHQARHAPAQCRGHPTDVRKSSTHSRRRMMSVALGVSMNARVLRRPSIKVPQHGYTERVSILSYRVTPRFRVKCPEGHAKRFIDTDYAAAVARRGDRAYYP